MLQASGARQLLVGSGLVEEPESGSKRSFLGGSLPKQRPAVRNDASCVNRRERPPGPARRCSRRCPRCLAPPRAPVGRSGSRVTPTRTPRLSASPSRLSIGRLPTSPSGYTHRCATWPRTLCPRHTSPHGHGPFACGTPRHMATDPLPAAHLATWPRTLCPRHTSPHSHGPFARGTPRHIATDPLPAAHLATWPRTLCPRHTSPHGRGPFARGTPRPH